MKTTWKIPDNILILRRANCRAAEHGIPLSQFVTEALEQKCRKSMSIGEKPWVQHIGKMRDLREETGRIDKFIEDAFETIDWELWK